MSFKEFNQKCKALDAKDVKPTNERLLKANDERARAIHLAHLAWVAEQEAKKAVK
jgi:hypothetical protein